MRYCENQLYYMHHKINDVAMRKSSIDNIVMHYFAIFFSRYNDLYILILLIYPIFRVPTLFSLHYAFIRLVTPILALLRFVFGNNAFL